CLSLSRLIATSHTDIYTLSLHDALPILQVGIDELRSGGNGARLAQRLVQGRLARTVRASQQIENRFFDRGPGFALPWAQRCRLGDRKSTRLNSSHSQNSYAVFCLKKKNR